MRAHPGPGTVARADLSSDAALASALDALRASPAIGVAREMTGKWAAQARASLADVAPGSPRQALDALCDLVVTRTG